MTNEQWIELAKWFGMLLGGVAIAFRTIKGAENYYAEKSVGSARIKKMQEEIDHLKESFNELIQNVWKAIGRN